MACCDRDREEPTPITFAELQQARKLPTGSPLPITPVQTEVEDFFCSDCGKHHIRKSKDYFHYPCKGRLPIAWRDNREAVCAECPSGMNAVNSDGVHICLAEKLAHSERPCHIDVGIGLHWAYCKRGHWDSVGMICPDCGRKVYNGDHPPDQCRYCNYMNQPWHIALVPTFNRDATGSDCIVITSANQKFIRGAYMMVWTLLRANDTRVRVYLYDVPDDDPHVQQMQEWGVEFKQGVHDVSGVFFSETWNKPACLLDAMADYEKVLWLDSDTSVNGSVKPAFDAIQFHPFAPSHGGYHGDNQNHPDIWEILGHPVRTWKPTTTPCAGIVGVMSSRDSELIREWRRRCGIIVKRPLLWKLNEHRHKELKSKLKFYDQGVLQDLWEWDTADGHRWSNFTARRSGTIREILGDVYYDNDRTIIHHGGYTKPWFTWPDVLNWGIPYAV